MQRQQHPQKKNERKKAERQCFVKMYSDFLEAMRLVVSTRDDDETISQRIRELKRPKQAIVLRQKLVETMRPIIGDTNKIHINRIIESRNPVEIIPGIDFRDICRNMNETSTNNLLSYLTCLCMFIKLIKADDTNMMNLINTINNDSNSASTNNAQLSATIQEMCGLDNTKDSDRAIGSFIADMSQKLMNDPMNFTETMCDESLLDNYLSDQNMDDIMGTLSNIADKVQTRMNSDPEYRDTIANFANIMNFPELSEITQQTSTTPLSEIMNQCMVQQTNENNEKNKKQ